jgi:tungstate transport system permease protein
MSFSEAGAAAVRLLVALDPQVLSAVAVSLRVSLLATLLATLAGVPVGFAVAARRFRGRRVVALLLNTLTALPTVVVGLLVYALLSRRGPLGLLGLLYTQSAMVIGETILATPLLAALTVAVISGADPRIEETALTLGATRIGAALTVLAEMRRGIVAAIITGFGRLIAELGVALMVGGNIQDSTRTMTTAIALETSKGVNVGAAVLAPAR